MVLTAVRVEGARELRAALRAAGAEFPKEIGRANKDAAQVVVDAARPFTPRRSGRLAESLRALGSQRSGRARAGSSTVAYAAAIHWGRKVGNVGSPPGNHKGPNRIIGRPFLWEAAQRNTRRIVDQYEQAVGHLIDEIARRAK